MRQRSSAEAEKVLYISYVTCRGDSQVCWSPGKKGQGHLTAQCAQQSWHEGCFNWITHSACQRWVSGVMWGPFRDVRSSVPPLQTLHIIAAVVSNLCKQCIVGCVVSESAGRHLFLNPAKLRPFHVSVQGRPCVRELITNSVWQFILITNVRVRESRWWKDSPGLLMSLHLNTDVVCVSWSPVSPVNQRPQPFLCHGPTIFSRTGL